MTVSNFCLDSHAGTETRLRGCETIRTNFFFCCCCAGVADKCRGFGYVTFATRLVLACTNPGMFSPMCILNLHLQLVVSRTFMMKLKTEAACARSRMDFDL